MAAQVHDEADGHSGSTQRHPANPAWCFYQRTGSGTLSMSQPMFNTLAQALSKRFVDLLKLVALWQAKAPGQFIQQSSAVQPAAAVAGSSAGDGAGAAPSAAAAGAAEDHAEQPTHSRRSQQAGHGAKAGKPAGPSAIAKAVQQAAPAPPAPPQLSFKPKVATQQPRSPLQPKQLQPSVAAQQAAQPPRKSGGQQNVLGMIHKAASAGAAPAAKLHSSGAGPALAARESKHASEASRGSDGENVPLPAAPVSPIDLCADASKTGAALVSEAASGLEHCTGLVALGPAVTGSIAAAESSVISASPCASPLSDTMQSDGHLSDESGNDGSNGNAWFPGGDTVIAM